MELLAVISIIAILTSVALPAVDNFFSSQRVAAEANRFIQWVRFAKYQAMETQVYHRLYFVPDQGGYQVTAYERPTGWDAPTAVQDLSDAQSPTTTNWVDATGEYTVEYDPVVWVDPPPTLPMIFFRPDGMLVTSPSYDGDPIPDLVATFTYGSSILTVNLTQIGVRASEEYYEE